MSLACAFSMILLNFLLEQVHVVHIGVIKAKNDDAMRHVVCMNVSVCITRKVQHFSAFVNMLIYRCYVVAMIIKAE